MNKNEQEHQKSKNIHQALDEIEVNLSQINSASDDLLERIKKTKDDLQRIIDGLSGSQNSKDSLVGNPSKWLGLFVKITSLATILGIIIGGINVYLYLKKINHLFLFPDNISISNASASIFIVYIIFYIILLFGFLSPFFINIILSHISSNFLNTNSQKEIFPDGVSSNANYLLSTNPWLANAIKCISDTIKSAFSLFRSILSFVNFFKLLPKIIKNIFSYENKERDIIYYAKFVYWSMFWFIGIFTIIFFADSILSTSLNKYYSNILNFLTFVFIFFNIAYGFIFLNQNKLYKNNIWEYRFWIFMIAILHILPVFLHFLFVIIPTLVVLENTKTFILFYIFSILIFSFSLFFSYLSFEYFYKNKRHNYAFYIASALFVLFYLFYVSIFSNYEVSLYKIRFIEKPQNSSWYLIHNGNTTSQTINGFAKDDIKKQKQIFNAKDCGALNGESKEKCQNDNKEIFNQRHNALYGYMAWNLGNTKVFCPVSVDFFIADVENESLNQAKGTNEKKKEKSQILDEKSKKCLVIDGKYLQPISEHYLAN